MAVRISPLLLGLFVASALLGVPGQASAQMTLTSLDSPVTEAFTGFAGAGLTSSPLSTELDSRTWRVEGLGDGDSTFGGWHTTGDFARGASAGAVTTGGLYAFYAAGASNPAVGFQPTETDATPGYLTLRVYNGTGVTVDRVEVTFDACYYNDADRSQTYTLQHSRDDATYTDTSITSFTPELASASPVWSCVPFTATMTGLSWSAGSYFYVRWYTDDNGGTGARDELAIDDVSVTALGECSSSSDCDDGSECTTDSCSAGACVHTPRTGSSCSDGDVCNGAESCTSSGSCESSAPLDCDDGDPCTADSCDAVTGCANTPIGGCGGDDAGTPADAGTGSDGGVPADAGTGADAGPGTDSGMVSPDGSMGGSDAGVAPRPRTGSRRGGCSATGAGGSAETLGWALLALILGVRRRRHR